MSQIGPAILWLLLPWAADIVYEALVDEGHKHTLGQGTLTVVAL